MARYVRRDGFILRVGSAEWRWWLANRLRLAGRAETTGHAKRDAVVKEAVALVGCHEQPMGSNDGACVHDIQSSTGAFRQPWCVSTVQRVWVKAGLGTWADDTANAYYLSSYAEKHGAVVSRPRSGCAVVYHLGDGHAGTVTRVLSDGRFWAVEGNWGDAVVRILRDPHTIPCTFVLRPELR